MDKLLVDRVLVAGNHLATSLIGMYDPCLIKSYDEALQKEGQPYADMWCAWRAIMDLAIDQRNKHRETDVARDLTGKPMVLTPYSCDKHKTPWMIRCSCLDNPTQNTFGIPLGTPACPNHPFKYDPACATRYQLSTKTP